MTLLEILMEEWERVTAEDKSNAEELDDEDVAYNDGWSAGMARAIALVRENGER
jgi:hypothetical protein